MKEKKFTYVYCSECLLRVERKSAKHFLLTQYTKGIGTENIIAHVQKMFSCSEEHTQSLVDFYEGRKNCTFQSIKAK